LITKLESAGYTIIVSTKCGLQCVKCIPPGHEGVVIKWYNKVLETVQQGCARKSDIACKVARLLSPSTDGLNATTLDKKFNLNGITRLEITFPFYKLIDKTNQLNTTWNYKQMYKLMSNAYNLLTDCLVSASIHDHLAGMEPFVKRSVVTYFPSTFNYKNNEYKKPKLTAKDRDYWQKKWPDGYVCRHSNRYTSKMNGEEVNATLDTRKSDVNGWDKLALTAAACCITGENPIIMICIGGLDKFFGKTETTKKPHIRHLYFIAAELVRTPVFPRCQLQTHFIGKVKNEWEAINVRPTELRLNPTVTPYLCKKEVLTEVSVPTEFSPDDMPQINDSCSEAVELFTGLAKGIKGANQDNMPTEPSHWSELKIGYVGQYKTEKLKFKYKGQYFWMPSACEAYIREHVFGKTYVNCTFRWGPSGFVCAIDATTDDAFTSTPEDAMSDSLPCAARPPTTHFGNISCAADIPPSIEGHIIEIGGFVQRKGNQPTCYLSLRGFCERFWIPKSLSESLFAEAKATSAHGSIDLTNYRLDNLAGCKLIKPDNDKIGVTRCANAENRMWIESNEGEVIAQQLETSRSMGERQERQNAKRQASAGVDGSAMKKQRIS
jgi:hypothetical protein